MGPAAQFAQYGHAVEQGMEGLLARDAVVAQLCQRTFVPGQVPGHHRAGEFRTIPIVKAEEVLGGDTVRYAAPSEIKKQLDMASKEIARIKPTADKKDIVFKIVRITAAIWQTHPFREGNTRSVVAFSVLLASKLGVKLDYELFTSHAAYVRNALVWCT